MSSGYANPIRDKPAHSAEKLARALVVLLKKPEDAGFDTAKLDSGDPTTDPFSFTRTSKGTRISADIQEGNGLLGKIFINKTPEDGLVVTLSPLKFYSETRLRYALKEGKLFNVNYAEMSIKCPPAKAIKELNQAFAKMGARIPGNANTYTTFEDYIDGVILPKIAELIFRFLKFRYVRPVNIDKLEALAP